MEGTMKILKSLEDFDLFIKSDTEANENKTK